MVAAERQEENPSNANNSGVREPGGDGGGVMCRGPTEPLNKGHKPENLRGWVVMKMNREGQKGGKRKLYCQQQITFTFSFRGKMGNTGDQS